MSHKILLVDDSQELLDAYAAYLRGTTPHEIRTASSARAALEIVRTWRPDVVVTDVIMPDMNGLELITRMRSDLPPPLPRIAAISGFPDFEPEARRRGAQVFQPKPLDVDQLVSLIETLVTGREPAGDLRATIRARRKAASELAGRAVSATRAHRPYFAELVRPAARLLSRYFDGADVALLLAGEEGLQVFASSGERWAAGTRVEGILGYALDVVESGSTLIVPDLATLPDGSSPASTPDARLLAAVPVRLADGTTIGALAIADDRPIPFDVHDLGILEYIAARQGEVFGGAPGARMLHGAGVLLEDAWRHNLGRELAHLGPGRSLLVALASLPSEDDGPPIPIGSREEMERMEQAVDALLERMPPRTALGRLTPATLGAYTVAEDPEAGERALLSIFALLEQGPRRACVATLSTTGVRPTDGGESLLAIAHWLLDGALDRGPATALRTRMLPRSSTVASPPARSPREDRYGPAFGSEKIVTVAGAIGTCQKNVAVPDVTATYCVPSIR